MSAIAAAAARVSAFEGKAHVMNLQDDDFTLFGLPRTQQQDEAQLDQRWKALQRQVHPDRFVGEGPAAQRVAMQWSVRVNEAYRRLRDPLQRAAYLCELAGMPIQAEQNTAMPPDFLMQQMEWREQLDEADSAQALQSLADAVRAERDRLLASLQVHLDASPDYAAAASEVRSLMFIEKFARDVRQRQLQWQHAQAAGA